jgi:hypothetical protein
MNASEIDTELDRRERQLGTSTHSIRRYGLDLEPCLREVVDA